MIAWLIEFEGKQKPLDELPPSALTDAIRPVREYLEKALIAASDEPSLNGLKIVFSVDETEGLKFAFSGPAVAVNTAVDLVGQRAEITPTRQ